MSICAILGATLCLSLTIGAAGQTGPGVPRYIFLFGDSYSSTGFNNTHDLPSRDNLFGNPPYPGITTANGSNWIDDVVYTFNNGAVTLCYNYAFPGALVTRLPTDKPVPDYYAFEDQTKLFEANAGNVDWNSTDSLFAAWFGINDSGLNVALGLGPQEPKTTFAQIAKTYFEQLDTVYQYGGRAFMIIDVPPVWRTPIAITHGSTSQVQKSVGLFNTALARQAYAFQNSHPGSQVSIFDPDPAINDVLDNPAMYGAPDATCTNENRTNNDCLWTNAEHPGTKVHLEIAKSVSEQLQSLGFYRNEFTASVPKPVDSSASRFAIWPSSVGALVTLAFLCCS